MLESYRVLQTSAEPADFHPTRRAYSPLVGSQFRLELNGEEYFIDLLLFHRRLHPLVAIELKIGKFQSEFVGRKSAVSMRSVFARRDRRTRTTCPASRVLAAALGS